MANSSIALQVEPGWVQGNGFTSISAANNVSVTLKNPVQVGDMVCGSLVFGGNGTVNDVMDNKGNIYNLLPVVANTSLGGVLQGFHLGDILNAPQTIFANVIAGTGFGGNILMIVDEFSGMKLIANTLDISNSEYLSTNTSNPTSGIFTTTQPGELIYGSVGLEAQGGWAFVQQCAANIIGASNSSMSFPANVGNGNMVVVGIGIYDSSVGPSYIPSITDNKGNIYNPIPASFSGEIGVPSTVGSYWQYLYFLPNITNSPNTITITTVGLSPNTANVFFLAMCGAEFSGGGNAIVDGGNGTGPINAPLPGGLSGNWTTKGYGDLVIGFTIPGNQTAAATNGAGFTVAIANGLNYFMEYKSQEQPSNSTNATYISGNTSQINQICGAAFTPKYMNLSGTGFIQTESVMDGSTGIMLGNVYKVQGNVSSTSNVTIPMLCNSLVLCYGAGYLSQPTSFVGTSANSCTLNPAIQNTCITISNGNLTMIYTNTVINQTPSIVFSTTSHTQGKYHLETTLTVWTGNTSVGDGIGFATMQTLTSLGLGVVGGTNTGFEFFTELPSVNVALFMNSTTPAIPVSPTTFSNGNIIALEIDIDNKLVWYQNLTAGPNNWNANASANPASGLGGISFAQITEGPLFFIISLGGISSQQTVNFGATSFALTPSAGFSAWAQTAIQGGMVSCGLSGNTTTTLQNIPGVSNNLIYSSGNLSVTSNVTGAAGDFAPSTTYHITGNYHIEVTLNHYAATPAQSQFGFGLSKSFANNGYLGTDQYTFGWGQNGTTANGNLGTGDSLGIFDFNVLGQCPFTFSNGNIIALEINLDKQLIWFQNLTAGPNNWNANVSANPASGLGGISYAGIPWGPLYFIACPEVAGDQMTVNFGATAFALTPSAGFNNW